MSERSEELHFRKVTKENFWDIIKLRVFPQQKHVAPNSVSIAEAHYSEYAWFRAVYYGDEPVGFVMLADPISGETGDDAKFNGRYFVRLNQLQYLIENNLIDSSLYWKGS